MCVKIYFHTSSHNPDNLRLQPLRFGLLKPAVVVSSFYRCYAVGFLGGATLRGKRSPRNALLFFVAKNAIMVKSAKFVCEQIETTCFLQFADKVADVAPIESNPYAATNYQGG